MLQKTVHFANTKHRLHTCFGKTVLMGGQVCDQRRMYDLLQWLVARMMLSPTLSDVPERVSSAICMESRNLILVRTYLPNAMKHNVKHVDFTFSVM